MSPLHQSPQAWFAFAAWVLFVGPYMVKKHPNARGMLYLFLGGMMFLPEILFFKLPMMPQIEKQRLANLVLLFAVWRLPASRKSPVRWWWWAVLIAVPLQQAITAANNTESLFYGQDEHRFEIQGLTLKDGFYGATVVMSGALLASYLGQRAFKTESDLETIIRVIACAGLVYSPLMLIEVRMSPQVHTWIYGFAANDAFDQSMRYGGYRPVVMMQHGLATALFILTPTLAATVGSRFGMKFWKLSGRTTMWFFIFVVFMAKSTAVWIYALVAVPLVRFSGPKAINRLAAVLLVVTCTYPYLRFTQTLPVEDMVGWFEDKFGEERAASMKFRFDNEDMLLEHGMKKPWFGWSTNRGRNLLYDDWGKVATITDGGWIIAIGDGGIAGLVLYYALPVFSMITVLRRVKKIKDERTALFLSTLNLCVAIHWIDILPNGSFNLWPEFLSGALCSLAIALSRKKKPAPEKRSVPERPKTARPLGPAPEPQPAEPPIQPPIMVR